MSGDYLESIEEFIFDDKEFVTYKFVSCKLGVHVNLAKQMLYEFHFKHTAKGKPLHAVYYISGRASQKWIRSVRNTDEKTPCENEDPEKMEIDEEAVGFVGSDESFYDQDGFLVLLCRDDELEEYRKRFIKIYSVHIYGLYYKPVCLDTLNSTAKQPLTDSAGNPPLHYGSFVCNSAFQFREDPRLGPMMENYQAVKQKVGLDKAKYEENLKSESKKSDDTSTAHKPVSISKPVESSGFQNKDKKENRLKNMFASAASKPKPKNDDVPTNKKSIPSNVSKGNSNVSTKRKSNPKKETSLKRKRIRDVLSSDSDDDEHTGTKSESEDDAPPDENPESPIPRNILVIHSDSESDDDFKEPTPSKGSGSEIKRDSATKSVGKKRICKSVPKCHLDDDGFLVTVVEQKVVSEEGSSEEETSEVSSVPKTKTQPVPSSSKTESKSEKSSAPKPKASANSTNTNKNKQATLMSFFQKK